MKNNRAPRRLLQLFPEIEPPQVVQARVGLAAWVASGAADGCDQCLNGGPTLSIVGLSPEAPHRYTAMCWHHNANADEAVGWLLGVVGTPAQLALRGPRMQRGTRAFLREVERAVDADCRWFRANPVRRYRLRVPLTWRERLAAETREGPCYVVIDRAQPLNPWTRVLTIPTHLEAAELSAHLDDPEIDELIERTPDSRHGDAGSTRLAWHKAELALATAMRRVDGVAK